MVETFVRQMKPDLADMLIIELNGNRRVISNTGSCCKQEQTRPIAMLKTTQTP